MTRRPYNVSLSASHPSRPALRTCYHYTIAAKDAKNIEAAQLLAVLRALKEGLIEPRVYATIRQYSTK